MNTSAATDIDNLREIHRLKLELSNSESNNKNLSSKVKELTALNNTAEEALAKERATNKLIEQQLSEIKVALDSAEKDARHTNEMLIAEKKKLDGVEDHLRVTSLPNPLPNIC
jgi:predicted  nucleic acid-binding Zn-ribbon protein